MTEEEQQRFFHVEMWLRSLATDIIEHEGCDGCRHNAATALEEIGSLEDTLNRLGMEDPRVSGERARQAQLEAAARSGQPKVTINVHAEAFLTRPDDELAKLVSAAVDSAIRSAVEAVAGASLGSVMATVDLS